MKLFKKIRKGFTLIELVVVIAVIAILSAVAVVSYISITNKAKQSSDEQAVRQMNTALKASSILGVSDITELYNVLAEEGMDAKNYKPLSKDTYFFWDQDANQIVYAKYKDGQYVGIYPAEYKDQTKGNHHWFSLSKEIQSVNVAAQPNGSYTGENAIESAEELYTVLSDTAKYKASTIELKADSEIDLMGADIKLKGIETFDGNNSTLSNVSQLQHESFDDTQKENSNSGLFGEIEEGKVINISNLTIENTVVGSDSTKFTGILGGKVNKNATVNVSNVKVNKCTIYGLQKVGSLFGYVVEDATINLANTVEVTNCKVASVYGEAGKLIGAVQGGKIHNNIPAEKFSVELSMLPNDKAVQITEATGDKITKGTTDIAMNSGYLVYSKSDTKNYASHKETIGGKQVTVYEFDNQIKCCFRYFNADAVFTVVSNTTAQYGPSAEAEVSFKASKVATAIEVSGMPKDAYTEGCLPVTASMIG